MRIETVSASTAIPIDLEDVKSWTRLELGQTNQDDLIRGLIRSAQEKVESITNRALTRRRLRVYFDDWPDKYGGLVAGFQLPYAPLSTYPAPTVTFKDTDSSTVTVGSSVYKCDVASDPGRICLDYKEAWPNTLLHNINPIAVTFTCGYPASSAIPENLKLAMKIFVADYFENRESVVIGQGQNVTKIDDHLASLVRDHRNFTF
jgi:uncharacterized phiE125 gp8 family phage protein